jgi:hypothetical protein
METPTRKPLTAPSPEYYLGNWHLMEWQQPLSA